MDKLKKNFNKLMLVFFTLIIIVSISYILKFAYDVYASKKEKNLINNITINETLVEQTIDNKVSKIDDEHKDEAENKSQTENLETKNEKILKLEALQKINSEIVALLEIEDTDINYPVLQTKDNSYYMKHNYKKEYSINGSIFLDKDYLWDPPSSNLLIYGHNNKNGTMFQSLLKYKDKNYYTSHPYIKFTTNAEDTEYEILSVFYSRVYYKSEQNVVRYYYFVNAETEEQYNDYINNCKKVSLYDTGVTAEYGEQLLTLSTCEYSQEDGRFVVVCKKIKK